jgi:hypothetical protein
MLSGEATNTNFQVLTRSGLESTIYRTQGEHANHYIIDAQETFVECHTMSGYSGVRLHKFYYIKNVIQVSSMANQWSYRLHNFGGNDDGLHINKNFIFFISKYQYTVP